MSKASPTRKMILIGCYFRGVSILFQPWRTSQNSKVQTKIKIQNSNDKVSKMATLADLGIERHSLQKLYENIDKLENLLKCPNCLNIVEDILTLQCKHRLSRLCSNCFNGSDCAVCKDEGSEEDIRKTNLDSFISGLRQLKYLTNYNERNTQQVDQNHQSDKNPNS